MAFRVLYLRSSDPTWVSNNGSSPKGCVLPHRSNQEDPHMQYSSLSGGAAMDDFFSAGCRNSSQTVELTLAAAEVVFRRMTLGGFAMVHPAGADNEEFARMVPEKARAFSDAGLIMIYRAAQIGQEVTGFIADEITLATEAATAVMTTPDPAGMIVGQADAGVSWAARLTTLPRAICLLALEAQAAALAPIHRAATDNVERLRKVDGGR
jgi:hypothetical protein